jgi:hypothetical protein
MHVSARDKVTGISKPIDRFRVSIEIRRLRGGRDQLLDNAQTAFPRCGHFWRVGIAELDVGFRLFRVTAWRSRPQARPLARQAT